LVGKEIALYYTALIWTRLGDAVRPSMERWMREHPVDDQLELPPMFTHWRDDARDEAVAASLAAGVTEGQAKSVLMFLEARALLPTDAERERILACREVTTLERWIKRAVNVAAVAELFADG